MNSYETLSEYYDRFTDDVGYEEWADFFERLFEREGVKPSLVLDLACGTGSLTRILAQRGYDMIGADASPEMLMQALQNTLDCEPRPLLLNQRMEELDLYGAVDACLCCLDSVNYVTEPEALQTAFERVHTFLNPDGLFVFDINMPAKLRGLDGQVFLDETDDTYCVWRTEFDEKKRLCYYGMDIFRLEGEHWQRSFEEHIEYAYEPAELQQWLAEAGFTRIRSYGDRVLRAPKEAEQRIKIERELMLEAVQRISLMASDKQKLVRLKMSKNLLEISCQSVDVGEANEPIEIEYDGPEVRIGFNPDFLQSPLRNLTKDEVYFEFKDENTPGVFKTLDNFLCVVMPMRL